MIEHRIYEALSSLGVQPTTPSTNTDPPCLIYTITEAISDIVEPDLIKATVDVEGWDTDHDTLKQKMFDVWDTLQDRYIPNEWKRSWLLSHASSAVDKGWYARATYRVWCIRD